MGSAAPNARSCADTRARGACMPFEEVVVVVVVGCTGACVRMGLRWCRFVAIGAAETVFRRWDDFWSE